MNTLNTEGAVKVLREALEGAIRQIERSTCQHEDTYRGGAIWTVCRDCGQKWADDRGGFVPYADSPELIAARAALDATAVMEAGSETVKHTPGPWEAAQYGNSFIVTAKDRMYDVAVIRNIGNENNAANACLIAAAPLGHEANKTSLMVLCALEKANDWHPNMQKDIAFAIEGCRAAIAAATGRDAT